MKLEVMNTVTNINPGNTIPDAARAGVLPIGNFRGQAAFWDLDMQVNQPLVAAEQQHILGILDGRTEGTDLVTKSITLAEAIGTVHTGTIVVPTTQVWYINAVEINIAASGGTNIITANWRNTNWPDTVGSNTAGQAMHNTDLTFGVGGGTQYDEFGVAPILLAVTNKPVTLRLPAGATLTFTFTNTTAAAAATVTCTAKLYGYIGKKLVQ